MLAGCGAPAEHPDPYAVLVVEPEWPDARRTQEYNRLDGVDGIPAPFRETLSASLHGNGTRSRDLSYDEFHAVVDFLGQYYYSNHYSWQSHYFYVHISGVPPAGMAAGSTQAAS